MGLPGEKFTKTDVQRAGWRSPASPLNILILIKTWEPSLHKYPLIGIEDDEFATARKLITKQEVRAVTLAKLQLQDDLVMWDIGAGSGSVSIEAANLMPNGRIFALEKNGQYLTFLKDNLKKFVARNVKLIEAFAPDGLEDLPDPDRVFIGGSGGMLEEIIEAVEKRLKPDGGHRHQRRDPRHAHQGGGMPGRPRVCRRGHLRQHLQDQRAERVQAV